MKPYSNEVIDAFLEISGNLTNVGFFIVDDGLIDKNSSKNIILYDMYNTNDNYKIN